jgi:RND family efflux transporter MFP subunit
MSIIPDILKHLTATRPDKGNAVLPTVSPGLPPSTGGVTSDSQSRPSFDLRIPALGIPVLALLLAGCGRKSGIHSPPPPVLPPAQVQVQAAASKKYLTTEEVVGTVRAKVRATLEAKVSGRIDSMPILLGQVVKAGQLVAHLDSPEIKARLEQAQASLQQAERDWKRASSLLEQQAVTRSESETAESRYRFAQAAVAEAQAMMGYIEVQAPFDGVVTKKWADLGDLATPGKPLIDIEDPSALQLEADVPEALASRIQQNASLAVRLDAPTTELNGTVSEIAPSADSISRTFRVKLALPQAPGLMPGRFARLAVPLGEVSSLRVPASALVQRGQLELVFVVANQRAQLHLVKTGKRIGDEVEILAGLDPGETVAVSGAALLVDGQAVETK